MRLRDKYDLLEAICDKGKTTTLFFAFVICIVSGSFAQSADQLYKQANQFYKSNQFDSAALVYEKILAQDYKKNAEVYYNLGNCYYKLNNISKSILEYERALRLSPRDEDIQHNLKLANVHVIDKIVPVPQLGIISMWNNFVCSNSSSSWGTYALGLMWLTLVLLALYLFTTLRRVSLTLATICFILSLAFISLGFKQNDKEQNSNAAILTVPNTSVKSAPDVNGNDLFMLHEGIKFELEDHVGEWTKIRLADGKVGWLEKSSFEKI